MFAAHLNEHGRWSATVDEPVHADGYRGRGWVSDGVGHCPYLALLEAIRYRRIGQKTARQVKRSGRKAAAKGRS